MCVARMFVELFCFVVATVPEESSEGAVADVWTFGPFRDRNWNVVKLLLQSSESMHAIRNCERHENDGGLRYSQT